MTIRQAVKEAIVLILAAVGIALAVHAVRPHKIGLLPAAVKQGDGGSRQSPGATGVSEISLQAALHLYEKKGAIFADARHPVDFHAGHIKGAVNLYAADQDAWLPKFLAAHGPDAVIVTYCDGEHCHLAKQLAELLYFNGFNHVRYLKNGWTRWHDAGFPAE